LLHFYFTTDIRCKRSYTYYKNGLLKELKNSKNSNEIIETFNYYYDENNNLSKKVDKKGSTSYEYDDLNRLKKVVGQGKTISYEYDNLGNREREIITVGSEVTELIYGYDYDLNLLTTVTTKKAGQQDKVVTYFYDKNGNFEKTDEASSSVNVYDEFNQLIKTTTGTAVIENTYNAEGLRVGKKVGSTQTRYFYEYQNVVLELNGNGNQTGRNIYGLNLVCRTANEPSGNETYFYMYNGHADVTALLKQDGTVAATYYYDAFGNLEPDGTSGNVNNNITYAGYQYDKETGLYYLNARMYDPKIARFLQQDTYTGDLNDPLSLNLYTYCVNNPISYVDPTGHVVGYLDENGKWVGYTGSCNPPAGYNFGWIDNFFVMTNPFTMEQAILAKKVTREDGTVIIDSNPKDAYKALNAPLFGANYLVSTTKQVVLGNFTEDVTLLGTGIQIGLSFTGLDLPMDIRDIAADIIMWKWTRQHMLQTAIDVFAVLPVAGIVKYSDEVAILIKNSDEVASVLKNVDEVGDIVKNSDKAASILKNVDEVGDIVKNSDEVASVLKNVDGVGDIVKNSDEVASVVKNADEVVEETIKKGVVVGKNNLPEIGSKTGYKFKEGVDLDLRGTGNTYRDALNEAFKRTGVPKEDFVVTKWAKDANGKSFPVEWRAKGGGEVSIDIGHVKPETPDFAHVGYKTPGKGKNKITGHIFVDDVPINR